MPSITSQPTNQVIKAGQSATFAVGATGTAPLAYQWQRNGTNISGATAASYTTAATTATDSGSKFDVVVSNTAGSVTSATVTLTVTPATLVSIAVSPANPSITKGTTQQFTATGTFSDTSTQVLGNVVWASGTVTVATISNTGLATTAGTGTSTISATSGSVTGSTLLTVTPATLVSIAVTPANPSALDGQSQQFGATGTYSDNSTQNLTASVAWTSLNTSLVTITSEGLATGIAAGSAQIQAATGSIIGSTTLTVTAPTLVQHVSGSNTRNSTISSPFCYSYQLPGLTTAGNAVVVGFTFQNYPTPPNPTPTVTDDKNDSYTIVENFYSSTDRQSGVGIAVAFNVFAGARVINLCFSSAPGGNVQPMATEFDNLTGIDGPGGTGNQGIANQGTGTSVTAGNMMPTASGDLVYQVAASTSGTLNQSSFTAGSQPNITWNLLSADLLDGWAGQYGVDLSTSAMNPTMSMGTPGNWVSAAILLRTGNSGSVPPGMRIVHLEHENIPYHSGAGGTGSPFPTMLNLQFPCSGNLLVAMIGGGGGPSETVTSMIDTNLNTWLQAGATQVIAGNDTVQAYYAGNAASSSNLGLTVNWTGGPGDYTIFFYDVAGAASSPLDTAAGATGFQSTAGPLTMPSVTITPATPNEIVFAEVIWDFNTATGLAEAGQLFDTNTFSGESVSGPEPVDENNGWGHLITTSTTTTPIEFTWTTLPINNLPVQNWAGMAAAFKAGP